MSGAQPAENFAAYAAYYDLLYARKDYRTEASYVGQLLHRHDREIRTVLELGSGTGGHAIHIAEADRRVHGIDRSAEMVTRAEQRLAALTADVRERVSFSVGDMRTLRLGRRFDAIISLFHVVSYQTAEEDVDATFDTAAAHLEPGGLFLFDFWYGPAVLTDPPGARITRVENEEISVTRVAEPVLRHELDVVEVRFDVFVRTKSTGAIAELRETHPMRYFFEPYLRGKLAARGFDRVDFKAWLTDDPPSPRSWYAVALARRA